MWHAWHAIRMRVISIEFSRVNSAATRPRCHSWSATQSRKNDLPYLGGAANTANSPSWMPPV
jgi:hypothetical protein